MGELELLALLADRSAILGMRLHQAHTFLL